MRNIFIFKFVRSTRKSFVSFICTQTPLTSIIKKNREEYLSPASLNILLYIFQEFDFPDIPVLLFLKSLQPPPSAFPTYRNTPFTKISIPMKSRITPPRMEALLDSLVPNFLPMIRPPQQMAKVTTPMIRDSTRAASQE